MPDPRPTTRSRFSLALLLPGILVTATGVGAGDLATAGLAGARIGIGIFWAVLFGAVLKLSLNEGLARWQMATGTTLLEGWIRRLRLQWVFLVYLVIWSFVVGGALISASGVAASAIWPLCDEPDLSNRIWGIVHSLAAVVLVWLGSYRLFQRVMAVCIGLMFLTVTYCGIRIGLTIDWGAEAAWIAPWDLADRGDDARRWVLGLIGGVGGTVTLLSYGYWIREERREGLAGVQACRLDLTVGYAMTAFFGLAMLVIASTTPDLQGGGAKLVALLGQHLGDSLGTPLRVLFLAGAWGAIFSSMLGVWQSVPYMFVDLLREAKWVSATGETDYAKTRPYRLYLLYLAIPPMIALWMKFASIQLLYAVLGACFMPLLAATLLVMNNRTAWVGRDYRSGILANLVLLLTLVFFLWLGFLDLAKKP